MRNWKVWILLALAGCGVAYAQGTGFAQLQALVDEVAPTTTREGAVGNVKMNNDGALFVRLTDDAGAYVAAGGGGAGSAPSVVEDAAETPGGDLSPAGTVRRDTAASSAATTGDNATLNTDANGALWSRDLAAIAEDSNDVSGDFIMRMGTVRRDTAVSSAAVSGRNATLNTDSTGRLWANTEMPDAVALTDALANPTVPGVGAYGLIWDSGGGQWVRQTGTGAGGANVAVTGGTIDVGAALPAGTNNIGDVDVLSLPALPAGTNNIGDVDVLTLPALVAGTANIGDVDVLTMPGTGVEDAGETNGATGLFVLGVRRDSPASSSASGGDLSSFNFDSTGRLWSRPASVARSFAFSTDGTNDAAQDIAATRRGVTWTIGGSPGAENLYFKWSAGTTPADQVLKSVSAGAIFVLTEYHVGCSNANTVNTDVLLEWDDAADVPFDGRDGIPAGGGWQVGSGAGSLRNGTDGQDLLLTATSPTTGSCTFSARGFTIAS